MESMNLGPNGSLVYCMDYLLSNSGWLVNKIQVLAKDDSNYFIFDCPGQVFSK